MKILFFNFSVWSFNVCTPEREPLGGIGSCVCYLARSLAARGHDITLVSAMPADTPAVLLKVKHLAFDEVISDLPNFISSGDYDAIVALNHSNLGTLVRQFNKRTLTIMWAHNFPDSLAFSRLETEQHAIDAIIMVSDAQRQMFHRQKKIHVRTHVIGNAIAPAFEAMFGSAYELLQTKRDICIYASLPFRGLDLLIDVMSLTEGRARLKVFSSMSIFQANDAQFNDLYERARYSKKITYSGGIAQPLLAEEFRAAAFLPYPCTWSETYCNVVQEALAAGLKVITNDLGALPETSMGYATLLPVAGRTIGADEYVSQMAAALDDCEKQFRDAPIEWAEQRFDQVQAINRVSTWGHRATEWEKFLGPLIRSS